MFKIQTLNKIAVSGLDLLTLDKYEISSEISHPDAVLVRSFKMHGMEFNPELKAIARAGAGVNNIPIDDCTENGVVVFNTPGANANAVKELVVTAMLLSSRKVIEGVNWAQTLKPEGDMVPKLVEKGKSQFAGPEIKGKKLGLVGLGAIGVLVANAAVSLGMEVVGYDPFISVESAWGMYHSVKRAKSLEEVLATCDFISLHVPLNDKTKKIINEEKLAMMKEGAVLLNFARGGLVDNAALIDSLKDGNLRGYVTDFPDADVLNVEGVIPIPHLGASTYESEDNCATMAAEQLKDYLETGNICNSVNFPACEMPINGRTRLTFASKSESNMLGKITTLLAENDIKIHDMINQSKGDVSYTIIDVESDISAEVIENIKNLDGIIMARVINP